MKKQDDLSILEPFLRLESSTWADTLCLTEKVLSMVEAPQGIEAFRHLLQDLEACPGKPLVLKAERNSFSPKRVQQIIKHIGNLQQEKLESVFCYLSLSDVTVKREENTYGQLIHWLRSVKRPVIMVFQGDTILPLIGIGLACDYRIATADTVFHNEIQRLDIPPGFGLLYLLPAYVGLGRAQSLVSATEALGVEKAQTWGLLDQIVTPETLNAALETRAQHMSAYSPETLGTIKALLNVHLPDFDDYFRIESRGVERAFRRAPWQHFIK